MIYQNILNGLCDIYNLPRIKVVFNKDYLTNPNAGGQYNFITNEIIIDENEQCIMEILFHEFRHIENMQKFLYGGLVGVWDYFTNYIGLNFVQ